MEAWYLLFGCACLVTAIAALIDYRTGLIPDVLTLSVLGVGIPMHALALRFGGPPASVWVWIGDAVLGVIVCGLVPLILCKTGGMGGGDLKLFAALGAVLGVRPGLEVQLVTFTVAALIVPAMLAYRGQLLGVLRNIGRMMTNPFLPAHKRRPIPQEVLTEVRFGPAIFAGTALVACAHLWR